jgi:hypothetical protein
MCCSRGSLSCTIRQQKPPAQRPCVARAWVCCQSGQDHGFPAKAERRRVLMRDGHLFPDNSGCFDWVVSRQRAILGDSRRSTRRARPKGRGSGWGPGGAALRALAGRSLRATGQCARQFFKRFASSYRVTAALPGAYQWGLA